eukprot:EG_transcript_4875
MAAVVPESEPPPADAAPPLIRSVAPRLTDGVRRGRRGADLPHQTACAAPDEDSPKADPDLGENGISEELLSEVLEQSPPDDDPLGGSLLGDPEGAPSPDAEDVALPAPPAVCDGPAHRRPSPPKRTDPDAMEELAWTIWDYLELSIPTWELVRVRGKEVPFFRVEVRNRRGLRWVVLRRFSDFQKLHEQFGLWHRADYVRRRYKSSDPLLNPSGRCRPHEQPHIAVPLPPTSWFARTNGSPQALEHRRWRLEVYLRQLLAGDGGDIGTALLDEFLDVPAVRVAQRLLASPRHLRHPAPHWGTPLTPRHCQPPTTTDAVCLQVGTADLPAIMLSPPDWESALLS